MAMRGAAALAMWWDMAPALLAEFEHWHTHEHFPERLGIPGFLRASRWREAGGGEGVFQLYELDRWEAVQSAPYVERLNAPSPWSQQMMPHHRHMVRSQCEVLASFGGVTARHALTVRLSPEPGADDRLVLEGLAALLRPLPQRAGLVGAHVLRHRAPAIAGPTTEQKIRGQDGWADWVLVVTGYDGAALDALAAGELRADALVQRGAAGGAVHGRYELACSAVPGDLA